MLPAPDTLDGFLSWPRDVVRNLQRQPELVYRLDRILLDGVVGHTDFSGKRCPETGLNMFVHDFQEEVSCKPEHILWWRSCDLKPVCVYLAAKAPQPPRHVFGSLLGRLPPQCQKEIVELRPHASASRAVKIQAYRNQREYLKDKSDACFPKQGQSCALHAGCHCMGRWHRPIGETSPLSMCIAGSMCTPWTSFGKHEGEASQHSESFHIWAREVAEGEYGVVTLENSPNFPQNIFEEELNDSSGCGKCFIASIVFGPEDLGWPVRRRRKFMSAIDLSQYIWVGPQTQAAIAAEFGKLFFKPLRVQGDVFLAPDSAEEIGLRQALAKNRGLQLSQYDAENIDVKLLMPPGERSEFLKYEAEAKRFLKDPANRSCIADISQTFTARQRMSALIPTLMSSTKLFSFSAGRWVTQTDLECSLGHPPPRSEAHNRYRPVLAHGPLQELSDSARQCLSGNAMHLAAITTWQVYVLSNIIKKDVTVPKGVKRPVDDNKEASKLQKNFSFAEVGLSRGKTFDYSEAGG